MKILNRFNGTVIFEDDAETMAKTVRAARKVGASLSRADLSAADLSRANLSRANLSRANLSRANLSDANLSCANLSCANLSRADLSRADLSAADLSAADLSRADLSRANLSRANLSDANLSRANLSRANLSDAKKDLLSVLSQFPNEVPALRAAIVQGTINGAVYEGECCCLKGTIAKAKGVHYTECTPCSGDPAERLFLAIQEGDTPETNPVSKIALEWLDEWTQSKLGR